MPNPHITAPDGQSIKKALDWLFPYIENIAQWPYAPDVAYHDEFPAAFTFLLFCGLQYGRDDLLQAYRQHARKFHSYEIHRQMAVHEPYLYLFKK